MTEGSRWTPMSGRTSPRMFGFYREHEPRRAEGKYNCKVLLLLLLLLVVAAFTVCWVSLRLSAEKKEVEDRNTEEAAVVTGVEDDILVPTLYTLAPGTGASSTAQLQETLAKPQPPQLETESYPGDASTLGSENTLISQGRTGRSYLDQLREARIVNRQILHDLVPEGYSPISAFTDEFAQLSGYRTSPRPLQDSLVTWLDKTPGVKFSGIYIKAEDSRPFLNGHAYVSDPFIRFKPPHPAEINQLAVEAERGTRFSNRPGDSLGSSSGTHTQAVFHPYEPLRPRPLKIMLDIYPLVPEPQPGDILADPRLRKPIKASPSNNRMIVHLNLYPKKNSRKSPLRRPLLNENPMQNRMLEGSGDEMSTTEETTEFTYLDESTAPTTAISAVNETLSTAS